MRVVVLLSCLSILPLVHATDLSDCAGIASDQERLSCYDRLAMRSARSASDPVPAPEPASEPVPVVQPEPAATADAEELFGKSDEEKNAAIAEAAGVDNVSSISTAVTSVSRDQLGKITIMLDNGQRWRQVRAERFDVSVGDEVVIKSAIFGSYTLQRESGGRKTKVRRVD